MVLNTTEVINYSKDIDYDYNAKFILMAIIAIYILIGMRYFNSIQIEYYWQHILKRVMFAFSFSFFFMLPMLSGMFFRTVSFDFIYQLVVVFYIIVFSILPLMFLFGYGEVIMRFIFRQFGKEEFMKLKIE